MNVRNLNNECDQLVTAIKSWAPELTVKVTFVKGLAKWSWSFRGISSEDFREGFDSLIECLVHFAGFMIADPDDEE